MKFYGWYSAHSDNRFGHALYRSPDGLEIKITEVVSSPDHRPGGKWNDYVYVGEVETLLKPQPSMIDDALPLNEQLRVLHDKIVEAVIEQKKCQLQFKTSGKCFCGTCNTKVNIN